MSEHVRVGVIVGGRQWTAFTRIAVTYSAKHAARAFQFTATDAEMSWDEAWYFMPGEEVTVIANGDLMLTGYIENMVPTFDKENHHIEVSGKSKAKDAIESSAEHDTGEFKNKKPSEICKALDKFGIGYRSKAKEEIIEYFRLNPGELAHDAMMRACWKQGIRLMGEPDGGVTLVDDVNGSNTALVEGVNILSASAMFNDSDQHSDYRFLGHRTFHTKRKSYRIEAKEKNSSVKRHRPKVIRGETDTTEAEAKKRVAFQKEQANGRSIGAKIRTQGWHDDAGKPWLANGLVPVYSPKLKLDRIMAISSVELSQDKSGSFSMLTLVLPSALGGKNGRTAAPWRD